LSYFGELKAAAYSRW